MTRALSGHTVDQVPFAVWRHFYPDESQGAAKLAHEKVEDYFNRLLQGRAQVRPLLPMLAAELRGSGRGRVNQAGLARAVELATARVRRDTAGRVSGPVPGLIQRAPGGPPIGGQSAPPPAPASGSKKP